MRRRYKLALGLTPLVLGAVGALAFGPVVRAKAVAAAERRGLAIEIGAVRPGWGRVYLRDVSVSAPAVPAVRGRVEMLEVELDGFTPRAVRLHGGHFIATGEAAVLQEQIRLFRARAPSSAGHGPGLSVSASGLDFSWLRSATERVDAWGLGFSRTEDAEVLSGDLVQGNVALPFSARGWLLELRRGEVRSLQRFTAHGLRATVDLDSKASVAPHGSPGEAGDESANAPARGVFVRQQLTRVAAVVAAQVPVGSEVDISGLELVLIRGGHPLRIGPGSLSVRRSEEEVLLELLPGAERNVSPLTATVRLPLKPDADVVAAVAGGPVSLAWLGVREGEWGLTELAGAKLTARLGITLRKAGKELGFAGKLAVDGVSVEKKWLAPQVVRGIRAALDGKGALQLDGSQLRIDEADVSVGEVHAKVQGELNRADGEYALQGKGSVPLAACQALLDATPEGLAPLLVGMRASGTFAAEGQVELDSRKPDKLKLSWNVANECRITQAPPDIAPTRFKQPFTLTVVSASGAPAQHQTGPGSPNWVPRGSISRHMETAVLICEDGRFWRHRGFDEEAIHNSIRENVKQGRFVRGASTISMQLAKNLYLKREKTLSRKLQEAVLTMLLEQELTKHQLLELYLNVIEFAPGVYGVGPGARHYFNTHASQISLGQALYMGSILSNPKRQHFSASGLVTEGWSGYLRKLMRLGNRIRLVSDAELEDGLREQVTFKVPYSPRLPPEGEDPDAPHESLVDGAPDDAGGAPFDSTAGQVLP